MVKGTLVCAHRRSAADNPPEGMRRCRLLVEFDGSAYGGWQRQLNAMSVQECLESAMHELTGETVHVIGCSRTDAGVHARGLVCHVDTASLIPPDRLVFALNTKLPPDIRIRESREAEPGFHARFSTCGKIYRYAFYNHPQMCAIGRAYCAHIPKPMDETRMLRAAWNLLGTHDFAAFAASGNVTSSTVRTLYAIRVWREGHQVQICVLGNGFLYNMVRIIAGTLAEIGYGKRDPDCIRRALETGNRLELGITAPACGLTLEQVLYAGDEPLADAFFDTEDGTSLFYTAEDDRKDR